MNIVGVLIAYNEKPEWLATAVAGFARVCDHIVYVDGSYVLFPGAKPRSNPAETEAVIQAAEAADCGLIAYRPKEVFYGNEVEKRNLSLRLAGTLEPDWVVVFDADCHVTHADPGLFRYDLGETDLHAATFVRTEHDGERSWKTRCRGIYRWTDDLRYGPAHWTIRGTYDGDDVWVWGPDQVPGGVSAVVPAVDLDSLVCAHRTNDRLQERHVAMREYALIREAAGVEKVDRSVFERVVA